MWTGIVIGIICFAIFIIAIAKTDVSNHNPASIGEQTLGLLWVFTLFIGVPLLCTFATNEPTPQIAQYRMTKQDGLTPIAFNSYQDNCETIDIPSYYYVHYSWINYWDYSESPTTITIYSLNKPALR